jgi:hypothetical protein
MNDSAYLSSDQTDPDAKWTARRLFALLLFGVLAACSSSGSSSSPDPQHPVDPPAILNTARKIVGVGDSLTAGEQSGGLVGIASSGIPHATQTHGFWVLLWKRANGGDLSLSRHPHLVAIEARMEIRVREAGLLRCGRLFSWWHAAPFLAYTP